MKVSLLNYANTKSVHEIPDDVFTRGGIVRIHVIFGDECIEVDYCDGKPTYGCRADHAVFPDWMGYDGQYIVWAGGFGDEVEDLLHDQRWINREDSYEFLCGPPWEWDED